MQKELGVFHKLLRGHILQLLPVLFLSYPLLTAIGFSASSEHIPDWKTFAIQV